MTRLRLLPFLALLPLAMACPSSADDDDSSVGDDDDAMDDDDAADDDDAMDDDDAADDDDAMDDDDAADDDDAGDDDDAVAGCPSSPGLPGTAVDVSLSLVTMNAPQIPGACVYLTMWGYDSGIADQAANQLSVSIDTVDALPGMLDIVWPTDAHDQIDPGGDVPANNRFYVTGWIDVDGDGVEGAGDYTSGKPEFWAAPPPPQTTVTFSEVL